MVSIEALHTQAMDMAEQADSLKMQGREDEADALYAKSFEGERMAAFQAKEQKVGEPSESIMLRCAASLAFQLKDYREAERLACKGFAGSPPDLVARELRKVLQNIYFLSGSDDNDILIYSVEIPFKEKSRFENFLSQFGFSVSQVRRVVGSATLL